MCGYRKRPCVLKVGVPDYKSSHCDSPSLAVIRDPHDSRVPELAHGLNRVVDLPGLHPLRDLTNNRVFHFDPWLQRVAPPDSVAEHVIPRFVPPSQDAVC
jgi:hypothetical protein